MREAGSITGDGNLAESLMVESRKPRYKNIMHLWEFLLELLADESCRPLITWSRQAHGEFKLKNQEEVAKRWGMFKCRPNMNYEKLSRALRHYYNQGIIKKVPGQRLVYKFHKLPYEYIPGRISERNLPTSPTRTIREDGEFCFKGSSTCGVGRTADDSERALTNKERMRRLLQERATMTSNLDKPTDPKQNEEERREVPSPPDSLQLPSVSSLPHGRPMMSTPVHPVVCCHGCSLQDVKPRLCCPTQIMYPYPAYENCRSYGWNFFQINPVPLSVITSRYYQ